MNDLFLYAVGDGKGMGIFNYTINSFNTVMVSGVKVAPNDPEVWPANHSR